MESQQRLKPTPVMIWKIVGASLSMVLGFGAAFYAGYNSIPFILAPCILLEVSCSSWLTIISRYIRGILFQGQNPNNIKAGFWIGCIVLFLSIGGSVFFAITGFSKTKDVEYKEYGLYAALVPCVLAVFWSSVLIFDSRYFWKMWLRVASNAMAGTHNVFRP